MEQQEDMGQQKGMKQQNDPLTGVKRKADCDLEPEPAAKQATKSCQCEALLTPASRRLATEGEIIVKEEYNADGILSGQTIDVSGELQPPGTAEFDNIIVHEVWKASYPRLNANCS
jgi:hypothetical protein